LLRWIGAAARVMIRTTIWHQLAAYNDKMSQFKKALTSREKTQPMFDLLPPQRDAIQDLMSIGNRALVVQMPTSSGKTLLAEFRILQTKVNVADSWIAYLVPTRALVNQVTSRTPTVLIFTLKTRKCLSQRKFVVLLLARQRVQKRK
jgi:superfamily II DNA or RNA helicase